MTAHRHRFVLVLLCCPLLLSATAFGQRIRNDIKIAADATPYDQDIAKFVNDQVGKLAGGGDAARTARDTLIAEAEGHEGAQATPSYKDLYARNLSKALMAVMQNPKPPPLFVKLNIGVVAEGVAHHTANGELAPIAELLMKEKQPALQLWGIQTGKHVLPFAKANIAGEIVNTVKNSKADEAAAGPMADEAYLALTLDPFKKFDDPQFGPWAQVVYPHLLALMEYRVGLYAQGAPPPSPFSERRAADLLSVRGWDLVASKNPKLRSASIQRVGELACAALHSIVNSNGSDENVVAIARSCGAALDVMGQNLKNPGLTAAGRSIAGVTGTTSPDKLATFCKTLSEELAKAGVKINDAIGEQPAADTTGAADNTPSPTDGNGADKSGK